MADPQTLETLQANGQIAVRYATAEGAAANGIFPHNPNGSMDDIAGICDPSGRVFGLMPHPEAYNHWTNHPQWPLLKEKIKRGQVPSNAPITPGIELLKNAVDYF